MKQLHKPLAVGLAAAGLLVGASSVDAAHGRGDLTVGLNGANEVGTEGDPNGSGKIDLAFFAAVDAEVAFPGQDYVCYDLTIRNVDPLGGLHIHEVSGEVENPRKDTGPVVIDLMPEPDDIVEENGMTCVAMGDGVLDGILGNPSDYYVNAHNGSFPLGAIRGQLHAFS